MEPHRKPPRSRSRGFSVAQITLVKLLALYPSPHKM
nr:MAG TPA: hypothetical protein [Caudoviricetes sp.]